MDPIKIETRRLRLRPWREDDVEALFKQASDERVSRLALWPRHESIETSQQVIKDIFMPNQYALAIESKELNEAIGCIGLVPEGAEHYPLDANEREAGYWIGFDFWNKGLTSEALTALCDYCFLNLNVKRLIITTDSTNIGSQRVAEKTGFKFIDDYDYEGVASKAYGLGFADRLKIEEIDKDKRRSFLDLLLIGDESEKMVNSYIDTGRMFAGKIGQETIAVIIAVELGEQLVEIKNIAVDSRYRRRGVGSEMVNHIKRSHEGCVLQLGTGESPSTLGFYKSLGFIYSHRVRDFFTDNYDHPIVEEGVVLNDMLFLRLDPRPGSR